MSVEAYVDEEFAGQLASNSGWLEFCAFVDENTEVIAEIRQLTEHGVSMNLEQLVEDARRIVDIAEDDAIRATAKAIQSAASTGMNVMVASDGTSDLERADNETQ